MRSNKEINAALDVLEAKSFAYGVWLEALAMHQPPDVQAFLIARANDAEGQLLSTPLPDETRARFVAELTNLNKQLLVGLEALQAQGWKAPNT